MVTATNTAIPANIANASDLFTLISRDSLFATVQDLVAIQPYSGWRTSATEGEREALDYMENRLAGLANLKGFGLETERQSFRVPITAEIWQSRLQIRIAGKDVEVPAAALRGDRDDLQAALHFDSDGAPNDQERQPTMVDGPIAIIRTGDEVEAASARDVSGKVVLLDYAAVDMVTNDSNKAVTLASELLAKMPAAVVMVTQMSTEPGKSHGYGAGDMSAFTWATWPAGTEERIPVLYVRLEDLAPAGIQGWNDLKRIESARLTWDADILAPATSGNLAAHIPGADPSRALILGAHIDSSNSPGAMDDASGAAILLEVARVLDAAHYQPDVDLYLVWFGSEELGLYGSSYYANTHQELLDRTVAMLEIDDLTRPLDGVSADLSLVTRSYGHLGNYELTWPKALANAAKARGVKSVPANSYVPWSDNSPFAGYGVPNADLIYMNEAAMNAAGGLHYAARIHDPYDTVETAREVADVFEQMARVALSAVVDADLSGSLRVTPKPDGRLVIVGSHTEPGHMTPAALTDFGMTMSMAGFDVDLVPYGRAVTSNDLADADLVAVLPVVDYPSAAETPGTYDDAWAQSEIDALEQYVAGGGLLVLTNSANRLKYYNRVLDRNEDILDANALAGRFGVTFKQEVIRIGSVAPQGDSPLLKGVSRLMLAPSNAVAFELSGGQVLAQEGGQPVVALVEYRAGQVLVLADVGALNTTGGGTTANVPFWQNLAEYARVH